MEEKERRKGEENEEQHYQRKITDEKKGNKERGIRR